MAERRPLSSLPTRAMPEADRIPGFRLIRELGEGGGSRVYLVEHGLRQRPVVLKLLRPEIAEDVAMAARLRDALQALRGVRHPHLEALLEVSESGERLWWVSEYLPGGDLRERLRKAPRGLPVDDVLRILIEITRGLAALHARGLVHRDLKPANILFDRESRAVIADYGLVAPRLDRAIDTRPSLDGGTPLYMSPEQQSGGALDGRADLYSLGCLFHEMLTGRPPFVSDDPHALARLHASSPIPALPAPLRWLQPVLESLLAKSPDARLDNTQQLLMALQASVSSSPEAETLRGYSEAAQVRYTGQFVAAPKTPTRRIRWGLWILIGSALLGVLVWWLLSGRIV